MNQFEAGHWVKQGGLGYRAFVPSRVDRKWQIDDMELIRKLGTADRFLGRLDAFSDLVDIDFYVRMHVTKEATLSARIEGTQTSVREALLEREAVARERRDDWEEVSNYIEALHHAINSLDRLPLSSRLICSTHRLLMQGVRGKHKQPGAYRTSQNWIGGTGPGNAAFVPPPHTQVQDLMSDLEKMINGDEDGLPELLKAALLHYQFETIHPFQDGNGRLGRLLIPLYLMSKDILRQPVLYLSAYFEGNRTAYYEHLTTVRTEGNLLGWFHFFLDGIISTARDGVRTFNETIRLERQLPDTINTLGGRSANGQRLLRALFRQPVISAADISRELSVTPATAYKLIGDFVALDLLAEVPSSGRGRHYGFEPYLNLFAEGR